jgi:hypothetical protein
MKRKLIGLLVLVLVTVMSCNRSTETDYLQEGIEALKRNDNNAAKLYFEKVPVDHPDYSFAQNYLDSIKALPEGTKETHVKPEPTIAPQKSEKESTIEAIESTINNISSYNGDLYYESKDKMQWAVGFFADWHKELDRYANHEDREVAALVKKGKQKLVALQKREFPKFRKHFGVIAKNMLWEHDIEVKTQGSGYTTIVFTASMFARNKNIKDVHETLRDVLYLFRFNRASYKWSKHVGEYTYYDMGAPSDDEL